MQLHRKEIFFTRFQLFLGIAGTLCIFQFFPAAFLIRLIIYNISWDEIADADGYIVYQYDEKAKKWEEAADVKEQVSALPEQELASPGLAKVSPVTELALLVLAVQI